MSEKRGTFTGKLGFVLAAAGSAVGLGNIWRFPYLAAQYGGGIFLLVYIILALTFGFALMTAEIAIGRKTGLSAIGAFKALDKRFGFIGIIASAVPMIILPYYSVIGGWVMKYMAVFVTGNMDAAANNLYPVYDSVTGAAVLGEDNVHKTLTFFEQFIGKDAEPALWFLLFIGVTAAVVLLGVQKGVENVSKVMMPILVILSAFIAVYSMFIPGAMDGVKYYLLPDFSKFSATTVLAAMGQLFYSMSLAMGIMITYGSYMKKGVGIESSVRSIELFDTGIAFLAGLMIIPAVFAFSGGDPEALGKGPSLMFITLPKVFDSMPGGTYIGIAFFVMVFFAALTSSISLMETVVSIFCDKFRIGRRLCCVLVLVGSILLGLVSCFGYSIWSDVKVIGMQFLDFFDFTSNSVIMPLVALLTCIFIGYILKPQSLVDEVELCGGFKRKRLFSVMIKYVAPVLIVLIWVSSILDVLGIFKI